MKKNAIATCMMLGLLAVPGFATSIGTFAFTGSSSGTVTLDASGNVTAISNVGFSTFTDGLGTGAFATVLVFNNALHTLSINAATNFGTDSLGTNFSNILSGANLITLNLSSAVTSLKDANASGQVLSVPWSTALINSISVNQNLLTDLGWGTAVKETISGGLGGAAATYGTVATTNSNSFTVNLTATPEPATMLLFGTGLLAVGLVRRKSRS